MTHPDERIAQLLVESLDDELGARLDAPSGAPQPTWINLGELNGPTESTRRRRIWAPVAASVAVAAAVIGTVLVIGSSPEHDTPPSGPGATGVAVTCAEAGGNAAADRRPLVKRAAALAHGKKFVLVESNSMITVTIPGASARDVGGLCASNAVEVRPLVAPVVVHKGGSGTFDDLGFPAPATEKAYNRLTSTQRARLAATLATVRCLSDGAATVPTVACQNHGQQFGVLAALLGAPLFGPHAVHDAQARPPSTARGGSAEWTVEITVDKAAARALTAFTSQHHDEGTADASAQHCGASSSVSCSDYLGLVIDGRLVSLPQTRSEFGSDFAITGRFDQASAEKLAAQLRADPLPTPLRTVSVHPIY